jgi:hypothetical protein
MRNTNEGEKFSPQGASASVVGGKHATTAREEEHPQRHNGYYNVYSRGTLMPTSTVLMGAGEIWKIGETTSNERYDPAYLSKEKVIQVPVYYGNQLNIKLKEKLLIYGYFFNSGNLPPGNKIFR